MVSLRRLRITSASDNSLLHLGGRGCRCLRFDGIGPADISEAAASAGKRGKQPAVAASAATSARCRASGLLEPQRQRNQSSSGIMPLR